MPLTPPSPAPAPEVTNVAAYLPRMARDRGEARAIIAPVGSLANRMKSAADVEYESVTYAELEGLVAELASGLADVGLARGDRVVLMVPPSIPFFGLVFALFRAGIVPVVLDPGMGVRRLAACIARARPVGFIGIPRAHAARVALGWGRGTLRTHVVVGGPGFAGARSLDEVRARGARRGIEPFADTSAEDVAAILFTSGSTGVPKGAVYTHGNFIAQVEAIRAMYGFGEDELDLPTFPLFALFDPALGMTTVLPRMDFTKPGHVDAEEIFAPIQRFGVTNMFGSPALLDRVASSPRGRAASPSAPLLPSLRRVITAGAPVTPRILESFSRLLDPSARIHTPYGATESLPIATIDHRELLDVARPRTNAGAGVAVGRPVPSAHVQLLRITDEPLDAFGEGDLVRPGEVGEITVSGPQVTASYFDDEANTRLHKVRGPEGQLCHRVGDVGYFDEEGRLWFCGRKAHRVQVGERVLFTERVEGPFNAHPAVRRTAFVGPEVRGRVVPTLCIEPLEPLESRAHSELEWVLAAIRPRGAGRGMSGRRAFGVLDGRLSARVLHRLVDPALFEVMGTSVERFFLFERFPVDPRHNAKIHREELRAECARLLEAGEGVGWEMITNPSER